MSQFASGRHSWSLCDRCGFRYRYLQIRSEEGTRWRVCSTCDDKSFNLVTHPQNRPPPVFPDPQGLRFPGPMSIWPSTTKVRTTRIFPSKTVVLEVP